MKLSIIIPIYNSQKSICRCLDSILYSVAQVTHSSIEIICVDDGSTDDSWKILKEYKKINQIIHIFHKENGGVGSARNLGLSKATGDYIAWVDADDYVTLDWYQLIYIEMLKYPDCIFYDYFFTIGERDIPSHIRLPKEVTLDAFTYEQSLEQELKNFLWNQVIRTDLLESAYFHEDYHMLEDYDMLTKVTPSFQRILHIPKCLYHYVQNESSLTHNISADILWRNIQIVKKRYDKYCSLGISVSINDYVIQLLAYLYESNSKKDKAWRERSKKCRIVLRQYLCNILRDKDAARSVKVGIVFAVAGLEKLLYKAICIKRSL